MSFTLILANTIAYAWSVLCNNILQNLVQIYGYTPTFLDSCNSLLLSGGLKFGTIECNCHSGELLRFAEGTGLKRAFLFADVPWDVKGIALAIAESVDNSVTIAAFFMDGLFEGLSFAPIPLKILALSDM